MRYVKPISRSLPARAQTEDEDGNGNGFGWYEFWGWWNFAFNLLIMATRGFGPKFL